MRSPRYIACLALGLFCVSLSRAGEPAEIRVKSTRPAAVGTLQHGVQINTNRAYTFARVPDALTGLQYVLNQHKNPGKLTVTVTRAGTLYVVLWEPALPKDIGLTNAVQQALAVIPVGEIDTEPMRVFSVEVSAGQTLDIPYADRWGTTLAARRVTGLDMFEYIPPAAPHSAAAEFQELTMQIERHRSRSPELKAKLNREALRRDSLISGRDSSPLDVVLRRTGALASHLSREHPALDLDAELTALAELRTANTPTLDARTQMRLFEQACELRKRMAFRNPLLRDIERILFLKRHKQTRGNRHMIDQYLGFNAREGGGVFVLEAPFTDEPRVTDLLTERRVEHGRLAGQSISGRGSFISLDLDYDADTLLFAWTEASHTIPPGASFEHQYWEEENWKKLGSNAYYHYRPDSTFHLFAAGVHDRSLRQLTDGRWNEFDPCFLPNGRIVFVSERSEGGIRCGSRPLVSTTLHGMMRDGSDIIPLSHHDTNEWHPSVDNDGMIVYTRWDYVDRDSDIAHHVWRCFPDGRDPRSQHGNYPEVREARPWMEMSIRAIPNSRRLVATAAPHHGEAYGSFVLIDERIPDDRAVSQIRRLTPEYHFPESESAPGVPHPPTRGKHRPRGECFGTAWPLSEDFYLCVFDAAQRNYGICLLDSFGNNVRVYADPQIAALDPIPLRPRPRPPRIPVNTTQARADRTANTASKSLLFIADATDTDLALPENTPIRELRIINVFPKSNAVLDQPRIGVAAQSLARGVLGTVPVEPDGSVYCEIPHGVGLYFQLLDEHGAAIQTMRSITYAHQGETLSCVGCHEHKHRAPEPGKGPAAMALQRAPSQIRREAPGSYPLTFPRLVQPVLDRHCTACHAKQPKAPSLAGNRFGQHGWSEAALTLRKVAWGKAGGNGSGLRTNRTSYSVPGQVGARAARLYTMLKAGHQKVTLPPADMRRLILWLDANSCFYGAYTGAAAQAQGRIVPPKLAYLPDWAR